MNINTKYIYDKYVLKGGKMSYPAFKELLFAYNKAMIAECIATGNEWILRGNSGVIKVGKIKRKMKVSEYGTIKAAIDWNASNKLKREIIARGELPYEAIKDEIGNKIGDNGGVEWLVYFTSTYYYSWKYSPAIFLKNSFKYKFDMSWTNSRALSHSINDNSELLYKLVDKNESK